MAICCCSLARTTACAHCAQNPFATDIWTNTGTTNTCSSTTPSVIYGEWISTGKGNLTSRCSVCGYRSLEKGNFCHNCGIAMRKES